MRRSIPAASFLESLVRTSQPSINDVKSWRISQAALRQLLQPTSMEPIPSPAPIASPSPTLDPPLQFPTAASAAEPIEALSIEEKTIRDSERYRGMRTWKPLRPEWSGWEDEGSFVLRMISFNILAQRLLEIYPYLYRNHDKRALSWERRRRLILKEIIQTNADIICLQEMQVDHLPDFLPRLVSLGYAYIYKRRTNDKQDGLLLLYNVSAFVLLEESRLELYQTGIERLSRDNVAIIAKFALTSNPQQMLVVATTHLLYNPMRNDVRLAQTQLLLAEIERIAYVGEGATGPKYVPILLAGDFNLEPFTGVYRFITEGTFEYEGKGRNLERAKYRVLSNNLVPPRLCVTDNCQHLSVLLKRLRGIGDGQVMLENAESCMGGLDPANRCSMLGCGFDTQTLTNQSIEIARGQHATFSSGTLTHPFKLKSTYNHVDEATTNQVDWITVDYIFHSEEFEVLERYTLPTVQDCSLLPSIPNFVVGSDHLCLGATFGLRPTT